MFIPENEFLDYEISYYICFEGPENELVHCDDWRCNLATGLDPELYTPEQKIEMGEYLFAKQHRQGCKLSEIRIVNEGYVIRGIDEFLGECELFELKNYTVVCECSSSVGKRLCYVEDVFARNENEAQKVALDRTRKSQPQSEICIAHDIPGVLKAVQVEHYLLSPKTTRKNYTVVCELRGGNGMSLCYMEDITAINESYAKKLALKRAKALYPQQSVKIAEDIPGVLKAVSEQPCKLKTEKDSDKTEVAIENAKIADEKKLNDVDSSAINSLRDNEECGNNINAFSTEENVTEHTDEEEQLARAADLKEREEFKKQLPTIRKKLHAAQNMISAGLWGTTVCVHLDGTVEAVGTNSQGECNVNGWQDIIAVSAGQNQTIGLRLDGTVVSAGVKYTGPYNLKTWKNIAAISAGREIVGLHADGSVVAAGDEKIRLRVRDWQNIVDVSAGWRQVVALQSDGSVVAAGLDNDIQCSVLNWRDIVAIRKGGYHTVGLRSDGSVVAVGNNQEGQCDVGEWREIVAISAGKFHTVGLRSDGTVVAAGNNWEGQCDVNRWQGIVAISAGENHTVGVRSNGTVVAVGCNDDGQCDVTKWKLFNSIETLEEEKRTAAECRAREKREAAEREAKREKEIAEHMAKIMAEKKAKEEKEAAERKAKEEQEAQRAEWRSKGLCQHCGGSFKGMFKKKCASCGTAKDY